MAGGTLNVAGSFRGSVTVLQGSIFAVRDVLGPSGFLSTPTEAFRTEVHVNRFYMEYYDSGQVYSHWEGNYSSSAVVFSVSLSFNWIIFISMMLLVSRFHTDLSLFDLDGNEVMRKTVSVIDPSSYNGITIYQTDWSISALHIYMDGDGPFNLAMAPLKLNGDKKLYGTFLPTGNSNSSNVKGISLLAHDLQLVVLYDQQGKFVGVRWPNSKLPIEIDGTKIVDSRRIW